MGLRNWIFNTTGICLKKTEGPFVFNELYNKKVQLNAVKKLEILALGSSHGAYSFIPEIIGRNSFNLCSTSQDLYYSYQLYKKLNNSYDELKTIVLFYSIFSNGFEIEKTKEKSISAYFKFLYNIEPKFNNNELILEQKKIKIFRMQTNMFEKIDNGFLYHKDKPLDCFNVNDRVNIHLRENKRENDQLDYVVKLINECNKNNQKLCIILSPARRDYKRLVPNNSFEKILELKKQYKFEMIDFFNSNLFNDDDFFDCDHVNLVGAKKLSNRLKDYL
ncbi:hypothetical protein DES39_0289 [Orbus hercynius]|uniref:Uncharacterized protein n=1 Tax=Orbus hercynius TaxID=593135 RepID=A0A495RJW7_9GAMM|nr:hypothetical protein [Orbus hercynius]RKS87078.1 hypothetical protein DES39_0289 [Orbus hercynius]